ncbi:MAG: general secretion pathway protein GspK [Deltaproteobacteria bacterium]|nr:general secretion pathway protein GspK [Deltaproteobacteria bacterium]
MNRKIARVTRSNAKILRLLSAHFLRIRHRPTPAAGVWSESVVRSFPYTSGSRATTHGTEIGVTQAFRVGASRQGSGLMADRSNERGIALFLVLMTVAMISVVLIEILYTTNVQRFSTQNVGDGTKAYYLAKTGIYMGMLELKIHDTLSKSPIIKQALGDNAALLDLIWQLGFSYPPPFSAAEGITEKMAVESIQKKSNIDGTIVATIEDLSSKINLNLLAEEKTRKPILAQLTNLLIGEKARNENFAKKYVNLNAEELVNNIADYIDFDGERIQGGDEDALYSGSSIVQLPLNRPFVTISQVRGVKGIDEGLYQFFSSHCTVFGAQGINVNTASAALLQSISTELAEEDLQKILDRRNRQPFKDQQDFEKFAREELFKSENFNRDPEVPLTTSSGRFSIRSQGQVGDVVRTIFVVVDKEKTGKDGGPLVRYWNSD